MVVLGVACTLVISYQLHLWCGCYIVLEGTSLMQFRPKLDCEYSREWFGKGCSRDQLAHGKSLRPSIEFTEWELGSCIGILVMRSKEDRENFHASWYLNKKILTTLNESLDLYCPLSFRDYIIYLGGEDVVAANGTKSLISDWGRAQSRWWWMHRDIALLDFDGRRPLWKLGAIVSLLSRCNRWRDYDDGATTKRDKILTTYERSLGLHTREEHFTGFHLQDWHWHLPQLPPGT